MISASLTLLATGDITLVGQVVESSNATFVVEVTSSEASSYAIYKPLAGERPLWDFEPGLYKRERAAYLLSEHLGLGLVPPTIVREDAPAGLGSLQWFVEADQREHYFSVYDERPETHPRLKEIAVFDLLANNTDRKSGHVLYGTDGRVWGIDHGLCFAADFKLRTVVWDFAGEEVDPPLLAAIEPLATRIPDDLAELLTEPEVEALRARAAYIVDHPVLPHDPTGRRIPWPLV